MMEIAKFCLGAIIVVVLYGALRNWLSAYAPVVCIAGITALVYLALKEWKASLANDVIDQLIQLAGTEVFVCMCKTAGILVIAELVKSFCRDSGLSSIGMVIDLAGRILALAAAEPILSEVMLQISILSGAFGA